MFNDFFVLFDFQIGQLIVFGIILAILFTVYLAPPKVLKFPRIVVPPEIVDSPSRSILLLDGDVAGSNVGGYGGIY